MLNSRVENLLVLPKVILVTFTALLPVINPLGTAIILLGLTPGADVATQRALARKIGLNTVIVLSVLLLGGNYLLSFFDISVPIVQVAGGLILASMGWNLLNQKDTAQVGVGVPVEDDPKMYFSKTFYPFTFPVTVGPGSVAVILTLSAHSPHGPVFDTALHQVGSLIGIIGIGFVVFISLAYSNKAVARLGPAGLSAALRLIAFIVVCIGFEITWSGVKALIASLS